MVRALQAKAAQNVEVTVEGQYRKLEEARQRAAKDGAHAAVIQAISVQNKLFGLEKSATETTVRMASRSPDAPQEIQLSVEEWTRQQSGLLLGSGMSDMSGNKGENVVDDGTASGPPAVPPSVGAASARDAEGARRLAEWRTGVSIGADDEDWDVPDDDLRLG